MNKADVTKFFKGAKLKISKHSPEILVGVGIAGMCATTVLAVKATPKALQLIEEKKKEERKDELTPVEVVQTCWKTYVPAAVTGVVSVACLIGSSSVSARRNAALATAYTISETALRDYREKVVETIGEKKEQAVREKVAQKKIDETQIVPSQIIMTGAGKTLFLDPISNRAFESDLETVRRIINDLNERMILGMEEYISLSEFYDEVGLSHTRNSDDIGWNIGKDGQIRVSFPVGKTDDGRPCFVLDYDIAPRYDYYKLM